MQRSVPLDLSGAAFNWRCVDLSDPAKLRPASEPGGYRLPYSNEFTPTRLQLYPPGGPYPTALAGGDVHSAALGQFTVGALRSWDHLWIPVEHDPLNDDGLGVTEVTARLTDGVSDFVWGGASWVAPVDANDWSDVADVEANVGAWPSTTIGLKVRLRTENGAITPACYGWRIAYTIDFAAKVQSPGSSPHPLPTSWRNAALWGDLMPAIAGLDFRAWGQRKLPAGAESLGAPVQLAERSVEVASVIACYDAGADGAGLGAAIPGSWSGADFDFDAPLGAETEVVWEAAIKVHTFHRPARDLVSTVLPLVIPISPRESLPEPPMVVMIPDVGNLVWKRWQIDRYALELELRIDAPDDAMADHVAETVKRWLDRSGGRVITSVATGYHYGARMTAPPRPGASFGLPQRIMTISCHHIPDVTALADVPMVNPAVGSIAVNVSGSVEAVGAP